MGPGGSIILSSSIVGSKGFGNWSMYRATKAAVRSFARTWASDLKGCLMYPDDNRKAAGRRVRIVANRLQVRPPTLSCAAMVMGPTWQEFGRIALTAEGRP